MIPPKPASRPDRVSLWRYLRLFRKDILSAQPERLYRAWMAEFRTAFFRSYLINDPALLREILNLRPGDFPKSERIGAGLRPLLGQSVFLSNGALWHRQRRLIDPAFAGGRLKDTFPAMLAAAQAAADRAEAGPSEIEAIMSHAAADVIFRTLFSIPIENRVATRVFEQFRAHQRSQPILNLAAFLPLRGWMPRLHSRRTLTTAQEIRRLIEGLTRERHDLIRSGSAPDDLATKIMTTADPETGDRFSQAEMVDQVAIFFLAGHETSAAALSWALYLLATAPDIQRRAAAEAARFMAAPSFSALSDLDLLRNVFRETLRLYPPVPMMVRETVQPERFRNRDIGTGAQIVVSPWHLHRHTRLWQQPDAFVPDRWARASDIPREAYLPFSSGARACPGAGFAMIEGPLLLAAFLARWQVSSIASRIPVPVAHLTLRARDGIWLQLQPRADDSPTVPVR